VKNLEVKWVIENVDFNPNSGMFDDQQEEKRYEKNLTESDDLEWQSSSEDFNQFELQETP